MKQIKENYSLFEECALKYLGKPQEGKMRVQTGFDFGNRYLYNVYDQTLFLDGILMDIMVDDGDI